MGKHGAFKGRRQHDIREHNIATILKLIRDFGPISRSDIVLRTGLSKATVSTLMRQFENIGVVVPAGPGAAVMGPKPRLLRLCNDFRFVVGVDLTDVRFGVGLVDLSGSLHGDPVSGIVKDGDTGLLTPVTTAIDEVVAKAGARGQQVAGIGVAISGLVDYRRGIVYNSTVFDVTNLPLRTELERRYGLPVRIDGDVNVRLEAEQNCDNEDWSERSVIYCHVGTGVGAGIFIDGKAYRGASGLVGEIGHVSVAPDGPICVCGRQGCLESVASWPALARRASELGMPNPPGRHLQPDDVVAAAENNNYLALQACADIAAYLGEGLAILANILNPHLVIVGGEIVSHPALFYPHLRRSLDRRALNPTASQVELRFSQAGPYAGITGTVGLLLPVILGALVPPTAVPDDIEL